MPIKISQIAKGKYYLAGVKNKQLRKVINIKKDNKKRNRIIYVAKSCRIPAKKFALAATKANPALDTTFTKATNKVLTKSDVSKLRKRKIILKGE